MGLRFRGDDPAGKIFLTPVGITPSRSSCLVLHKTQELQKWLIRFKS